MRPAAEQRHNRALPRQGGKLVQEGITGTEYHAGTQDRDAVEGFLDETLSDSPGADIRRVRPGVGPQSRDVDQPLDSRLLCLAGDMQGALPVDLVEGGVPCLDVVANRIDHRSGTFHRPCDRRFVRYIGVHEFDPAISTELPKEACTVRVAYAHTHPILGAGQVFHDLAPEESRSPEHRDEP